MTIKHPCETLHDHPAGVSDLAHIMLGAPLGYGISRNVYALERDQTCVIKYEPSGDEFQNQAEWRIWQAVKNTDLAKWFAPCIAISPNGLWLIQRRLTFPPRDQYPAKLPHFFPDTKYLNFGKLGKQWCACDYGTPAYGWLMHRSERLVSAKWWGEDSFGNKDT